jgi:hypothetical protein
MKVKIIMKHHQVSFKWPKWRTLTTPNAAERVDNITAGGNVKWCSYFGKQFAISNK